MFCLCGFFLVETHALFFFLLLLLLLFFACITHDSLRKNCAPLSLSLSSLKKSKKKEHEKIVLRDLDFTQEELITHHKKKKRTERSLFTLSLSLVLFSKTNKLFSSVVFAKTSRRSSFLLLYLSSVLLFNTSSLVF